MKALVTGSSGHLGEALVLTLRDCGWQVVGLDMLAAESTAVVGSICDRETVAAAMAGVDAVFHAATLHKPHLATHSSEAFLATNVQGTLVLLEAARDAGVSSFVFTSTTSVFGDALRPARGMPAAWITEAVTPLPKNLYGMSKLAAENLCRLFARNHGLACMVLRTSRFFPEADDDPARRAGFAAGNLKVNELLYRRADIADMVSAHLLAARHAPQLGFGTYIVSASTPLLESDLAELRASAPAVVQRYFPDYPGIYSARGWRMLDGFDRVYVSTAARDALGWEPVWDFRRALDELAAGREPVSPLTRRIGSKGYHPVQFSEGPYPVNPALT